MVTYMLLQYRNKKFNDGKTPTYVFPKMIRDVIRRRFPSKRAGQRDDFFNNQSEANLTTFK